MCRLAPVFRLGLDMGAFIFNRIRSNHDIKSRSLEGD